MRPTPVAAEAARRGRRLGPGDAELFAALDRLLAAAPAGAAVAVLHDGDTALAGLLAAAHPRVRVVPVRADRPAAELHVMLAARGRFRLVVDDVADPPLRAELFPACFWHLEAGGHYLVRNFRTGSARGASPVGRLVLGLAARPRRVFERVDTRPGRDGQRLAAAMGPVLVDARHLQVAATRSVLAKVREEEAAALLAELGPAAGRVLRTLPAVELPSRCTLHTPLAERDERTPATYRVPELGLREYHDVVCAQEQVALLGNVVLPDSYRHLARPRLKSKALPEVAPRFARPRRPLPEPEPLPGEYYYLDNEHRGHFGHVMTEVLSKLWAWDELKAERPGLKALVAVNRRREVAGWEHVLLEAAGIRREDLVVVRRPVRVETLVAAAPLLSMPDYVHPDIAAEWRRLGDALVADAPDRDYPARIFCARRTPKRSCRNAAEVEALFAAHGFTIVYAEDHPIPEQVAMFRRAEVVAGYAGSALFNLCWAVRPQLVVTIASESYTARNEYLIASVLGHEMHALTSVPEIPQVGPWSKRAFESDYTVDFDREGRYLRDLLASL